MASEEFNPNRFFPAGRQLAPAPVRLVRAILLIICGLLGTGLGVLGVGATFDPTTPAANRAKLLAGFGAIGLFGMFSIVIGIMRLRRALHDRKAQR